MSESRKVFDRVEILIRPDQRIAVQEDADVRYPTRHGATGQRRNFSPAMRDILDFWNVHYALFLPWIASRDSLPPQAPGGAE